MKYKSFKCICIVLFLIFVSITNIYASELSESQKSRQSFSDNLKSSDVSKNSKKLVDVARNDTEDKEKENSSSHSSKASSWKCRLCCCLGCSGKTSQ